MLDSGLRLKAGPSVLAYLLFVPFVGGPPIVIGTLFLRWGLRRDRRKGGR